MRVSASLALLLLLAPGPAWATATEVATGGAFVWINLMGARLGGEKYDDADRVQLTGYSHLPPAGQWKILHKGPHPRGVGFGRLRDDRNGLLWAASYVMALEGSVDGVVPALVGQPVWRAPPGFRVLEAEGSAAHHEDARCIRVKAMAELQPRKPKPKSGLHFSAHCLACAHPTAPGLHLVMMFAERKSSRADWSSSAEDAEAFFESLRFRELESPIVKNFLLEGGPGAIEALDGFLWVTLSDNQSLAKIDPDSGRTLAEIDLPGSPSAVASGDDSLWILVDATNALLRIDPKKLQIVAEIHLPSQGRHVATGAGAVWVSYGSTKVSRVDPTSDRVAETLDGLGRTKQRFMNPMWPNLSALAFAEPWVWVADFEHNFVYRIDPLTNEFVKGRISVGRKPRGIVTDDTAVWVLNGLGESVSRIDRRTEEVLAEIDVPGQPWTGLAHGGSLWILSPHFDQVTQIDTRSYRVVGDPIWVGLRPLGLAVHDNHLWVTSGHSYTLSKIRLPSGGS